MFLATKVSINSPVNQQKMTFSDPTHFFADVILDWSLRTSTNHWVFFSFYDRGFESTWKLNDLAEDKRPKKPKEILFWILGAPLALQLGSELKIQNKMNVALDLFSSLERVIKSYLLKQRNKCWNFIVVLNQIALVIYNAI